MADSRTSDIESQVRLNLAQIGVQNIQAGEIHRKAKRVVRDLIIDLKPIEREITITTVEDQESYDLEDEKALLPKVIETSWDESMYFVDNTTYKTLSTTGNDYPVYMTFFNRQAHLRPIPGSDGDIITLWAYQTDALMDVGENTAPETPEYLDEAIILGICAQYNKKEFQLDYEMEKKKWRSAPHLKHVSSKQVKAQW